MTRGEVWWVEDPAVGRRPHLIVTRDVAIPLLRNLIAVPATTSVRGIPTEVALGREDGMPKDCVLSLENMSLLPKTYFIEPICKLGPERMAKVCQALDYATGCG